MSRAIERARDLLRGPHAWLDRDGETYALRTGRDRRSRVSLRIDETVFRALAEEPGLRGRPGGGWAARRHLVDDGPAPGRPGLIEGERTVMEPDGSSITRRANLGQSPIAWLAARKDTDGRSWLGPLEVAAGARLTAEVETALSGPSLTMRWDALPRSRGATAARVAPGDRALAAGRRVEAALDAVGPRLRPILEQVCVRGSAMAAAENTLGLRRRTGKIILKAALLALARHYRMG